MMKKYFVFASIPVVLLLTALAIAQFGGFPFSSGETLMAPGMTGLEEVPVTSSVGTGDFQIEIAPGGSHATWILTYSGLEADVQQAHIHAGQKDVNGGISIWLCSNLASPPTPPGTQPCPLRAGTISGIATANNVVGPSGQGINPGEFAEVIRLVREGKTYANVHTTRLPGGEIRGQIRFGQNRGPNGLNNNGPNGLNKLDHPH